MTEPQDGPKAAQQRHDLIHETLSHKYRAKAFLKRCSYDDLLGFKEVINEVLDLKREEYEAEKAAEAERLAKVEKIEALMSELGVSYTDLGVANPPAAAPSGPKAPLSSAKEPRKTAGLRRVKYKCTMFGADYFWTGAGHAPQAFKAYFAKGYSKADCLLPEEDQFIPEAGFVLQPPIPEKHQKQLDKLLADYARQNAKSK